MPALTWKLSFAASTGGSYIELTEVAFLNAAGDDLCVGGTPGANSYYGGGYEAANAFDKNLGTNWCNATGVLPAELWYTLPAQADVARIRIRFAPSSSWLPTGLEAITLSGAGADGVYEPLVRYPISIESGSIAASAEVVLAVGTKQPITLRAPSTDPVLYRLGGGGVRPPAAAFLRQGGEWKPIGVARWNGTAWV